MSCLKLSIKRFFRRILSEDIKTILIFLLVIFSIYHVFVLSIGWLGASGLSFNTPSVSVEARSRSNMIDSDNDLLPDIIELAPKGSTVLDEQGNEIGRGTGTNPFDPDTDGDLFTDGAEDSLGTDGSNWFSPGYLYIIWALIGVYIITSRFRQGNLLREYQEFEQLNKSGGVSTDSSKFAYGTSSIFSKGVKDMSAEERRKLIQSDQRYHAMVESNKGPPSIPLRKRLKLRYRSVLFLISMMIAYILRYILTN